MRHCARYFEKKSMCPLSGSSFNMASKHLGLGLSCTRKSDKVLYKHVTDMLF